MVQFKCIFLITVIGFILFSGCIGNQGSAPTPTLTPNVTAATPTGNNTLVKLDSRGGFFPNILTIKVGDEILWDNYDEEIVTLVSNDGLFDAQILASHQQYQYTFKYSGTYTFSIEQNKSLNCTIRVET